MWCTVTAATDKEQRSRSKEARLLDRFINLCNVYSQNGDYFNAMLTVERAITSLPTNQITDQETMISLVSQWIRIKRHLASESNQLSPKEARFAGRSLMSALKRVNGLSDDVRILYLETELSMCQGQRSV